jgi:hypothetical protein
MPVKPEKESLYPGGSSRSPEWRAIRERILKRAGNRCEGTPQEPHCRAPNGLLHPVTGAMVVLTIAHMDCALVDHSDENLRALCQRCHNRWDNLSRRMEAQRTREKAAGIQRLPMSAPMVDPTRPEFHKKQGEEKCRASSSQGRSHSQRTTREKKAGVLKTRRNASGKRRTAKK